MATVVQTATIKQDGSIAAPAPVRIEGKPLTRVMLVLALLVMLVVTIASGLGSVLHSKMPAVALRIAPWDARAAGRLSQKMLVGEPRQLDRARRLADQALRRDTTVVAAVVTQGAIEELRGRSDRARRAFIYAASLSRRDLATQLWWIENGVAKGDIKQALQHYDIALRAIKQAPDVLFPVLSAALSQPDVRHELISVLKRDPAWKNRFLQWLVINGVNNRSAADMFTEMRRRGHRSDPELLGQLERVLVEERDYETAWSLYRQRHPEARRDGAREKDFASASTGGSPFGWNLVDDQGVASIGQMRGADTLTFATVSTSGGILARQLQLLPPGTYRVLDDVQIAGQISSARPYWSLRCIDGRELGRVPLGEARGSAARFFVVPANCPVQWFVVAVDAGDAIEGVDGTVRAVSLVSNVRR